MELFAYILVKFVYYFILVMQFLLLVRAVSSFFVADEENAFIRFLFYATEPIVFPIRALLYKSESVRNFPIDFSIMLTMLVLTLIEVLLPTV